MTVWCHGASPAAVVADMSQHTSEVTLVLDVFRAIEQRDHDLLFSLLDDRVEFQEAASLPYGGISRGKDTLRDRLEHAPERTWLGTWDPLQPSATERRMDPLVIAQSGSAVVVEYRQRAVSAAGQRFDAPVLALYDVCERKLARARMFHFDTAAIERFLLRAT
jgi:ketosteroid isomerase-like protein